MEEGEEERQHRSTHALSFTSQGQDEIHLRNLVKASAPKDERGRGRGNERDKGRETREMQQISAPPTFKTHAKHTHKHITPVAHAPPLARCWNLP